MSTVGTRISSSTGDGVGPSVRDRRWWIPGRTRSGDIVAAGLVSMVLLLVLSAASGQIEVNQGYGYDGADYVEMVNNGVDAGMPITWFRPLVILIVAGVDRLIEDPIASFRAVNLVFAGLLGLLLADLCRRYGASRAATATLVLNLGLSIATANMFAFYPTLINSWRLRVHDRGRLGDRHGPAPAHRRDLRARGAEPRVRRRAGALRPGARSAPAALATCWWWPPTRRSSRRSRGGGGSRPVMSRKVRLRARSAWPRCCRRCATTSRGGSTRNTRRSGLDFALTLFGGVRQPRGLLFAPRAWWRCLRREPEWLIIVLPIAAVTAVGYIDMWRYSAFVLPAVPVLWVWGVSDLPPAAARRLFVGVTLATLVTQRPWQAMDVASYFRDWFPYFLVVETPLTAAATLWPLWTWRFAATGRARAGAALAGPGPERRRRACRCASVNGPPGRRGRAGGG